MRSVPDDTSVRLDRISNSPERSAGLGTSATSVAPVEDSAELASRRPLVTSDWLKCPGLPGPIFMALATRVVDRHCAICISKRQLAGRRRCDSPDPADSAHLHVQISWPEDAANAATGIGTAVSIRTTRVRLSPPCGRIDRANGRQRHRSERHIAYSEKSRRSRHFHRNVCPARR